MSQSIITKTVNRGFAEVENDFILHEELRTRIIFRAQIHTGGIRGKIIRLRKNDDGSWEKDKPVNFRNLNPGEGINVELPTDAVKKFDEAVGELISLLAQQGVKYGRHKYVTGEEGEVIVTTRNKATLINQLLNQGYSEEIWNQLTLGNPGLATRLSWSKIHTDHKAILTEFKNELDNTSRNENWWQDFFDKNKWIFGYGLSYKILRNIQSQPNYGGTNVSGQGGQRGDSLHISEAEEAKFTVLVEIKKPNTPLLNQEYRNGAWSISEDLAGGISQLQTNCRTWEVEGSVTESNRDRVETAEEALTITPKGILVIGRTNQLTTRDQKKSFELLRCNLHNPEIITFDELYNRASFIVNQYDS